MVVSYANLLFSSGRFQPEMICVKGKGNFLDQQNNMSKFAKFKTIT